MEASRPIVLSIAGTDPSAGAGLLADIKTFEQHRVYGLGISTARTVQTESEFFDIRWEEEKDILQTLDILLSQYDVKAVKIGLVKNIPELEKIVSFIHQKNNAMKIVVDPVISTTSGFDFWEGTEEDGIMLFSVLEKMFLLTPNYNEVVQLIPNVNKAKTASEKMALHCNVLLKGGHNHKAPGIDYLFLKDGPAVRLDPESAGFWAKHGSGCVLSSAITANLALGQDLVNACKKAKRYAERFFISNKTLLGYHNV